MHEFQKLLDFPYLLFDSIYDNMNQKDFDIKINDIVLKTEYFDLKIVDTTLIHKMISWYEKQDEFEKCQNLNILLGRLAEHPIDNTI